MEIFKFNEQLNNLEDVDAYNITRFLALVIYLEAFLKYFLATSFLNLLNAGDLYNFILANWSKVVIAIVCYYPIQRISGMLVLLWWHIPNIFKWLEKNNETEYETLEKQNRIISLDDADEIVRKFSDKKLEKQIEEKRESYRKQNTTKFRIGLILNILLGNALLFWTGYSETSLIFQSSLYQIPLIIVSLLYLLYPYSIDYEYVSTPIYLTQKDLREIEQQKAQRYGRYIEEIDHTSSKIDLTSSKRDDSIEDEYWKN